MPMLIYVIDSGTFQDGSIDGPRYRRGGIRRQRGSGAFRGFRGRGQGRHRPSPVIPVSGISMRSTRHPLCSQEGVRPHPLIPSPSVQESDVPGGQVLHAVVRGVPVLGRPMRCGQTLRGPPNRYVAVLYGRLVSQDAGADIPDGYIGRSDSLGRPFRQEVFRGSGTSLRILERGHEGRHVGMFLRRQRTDGREFGTSF